jgi:hypothetical protein
MGSAKPWLLSVVGGMISLFSAGCATADTPQQARLTSPDAQSMTKVRAVLATIIGRTRFELGPEDLTTSSTITVLPPPLGPMDTRSMAVPMVFDIIMIGQSCALVERDTKRTYPMDSVACTPITGR